MKQSARAPRRHESESRARVPGNAQTQDGRSRLVKTATSKKKPSHRDNSPESPQSPWIAKSKGGKLFTPQENRLLIENYDDIMNIDENEEINAWAAWSVKVKFLTCFTWILVNVDTVPKSYASGVAELLQQ